MGWTKKCERCGKTGGDVRSMPILSRGGRNACMCNDCLAFSVSYHGTPRGFFDNPVGTIGTMSDTLHRMTRSHEIECMDDDEAMRLEAYLRGWIASDDCTVTTEYERKPSYNARIIVKDYDFMQIMQNSGHASFSDSRCGLHSTFGIYDDNGLVYTASLYPYYKNWYHTLLVPATQYMQSNPEKTVEIFGRNFAEWAMPINENSNPTEHRNWVNIQHTSHIEFRLPHFTNKKQMMRCHHLIEQIAADVFDFAKESRRYSTEHGESVENRTERKAIAEKWANIILDVVKQEYER